MSGLLPKEGRWIARPKKPRWSMVAWGGLGFAFLVQGAPAIARAFHRRWLDGSVLFVILLVVALAWIREIVARRRTAADAMMVEGAFGEQFPVEVTVVVKGSRLGSDRGVIWFADGLMGFSGSAFSFVLAASDFKPNWEGVRTPSRPSNIPVGALVLKGTPRPAYLHVLPVWGHAKAFRNRLADFVAAKAAPKGERVWPPFERYVEEEPVEAVVRR